MPKTQGQGTRLPPSRKPYVDRALHDEELRDNVKQAFTRRREIYDELVGEPRRSLDAAAASPTDKDIQDHLKTAVDELRSAADRLQGRSEHHGPELDPARWRGRSGSSSTR